MQPKAIRQATPEGRGEPAQTDSRHDQAHVRCTAEAADGQGDHNRDNAGRGGSEQCIRHIPGFDPAPPGRARLLCVRDQYV
jgi:hypothetical protein